jgi:hypothetical protein
VYFVQTGVCKKVVGVFVRFRAASVINPLPVVDVLCGRMLFSYILPVITNGNYYTGSNGTGTLLHAGDLIKKWNLLYFLAVLIQNLYQTI